MAYAALTSLAGVIDQILPQDQRYISLCGKDQMKSLHEKVSFLQEFLEYVSLRSFLPDIDVLESRIRDTAHKMEDTIELVILSELCKESETPDEFFSCFESYLQPFLLLFKFKNSDVQPISTSEFSCYLEQVHVLLEEAMEMKKIIDNNEIRLALHPLTTTTSSREAPAGSKSTKVGLEKALSWMLDQVIKQGSTLRIVPITGMGGIGKTTLARASYEALQTLHHFDVRFWVTVSQGYNIQDILRGLLPKAEQTTHRDEQLIEHVHKYLTGRRYLIVLDDMWDEKVWDRVRNAFPDDNKGSRVIITTRLSGVATYVGSLSHVHEMQFLNEDQSWDLLRENVYGHECCSTEFEGIGRMIARNCKGLPLAVVVIAGLLKVNKTRDYWEQAARNTNEKAITSNDHLFEILCWSYTRLPPHLKACFLYMGNYKEDYEIPTKELLRLWAAEGFLKPKQSKSMEEVAEECLEELVERSLVLVTKRWYNGKIRTCSVHDVIREVSIRKAEEEKFHYHFNGRFVANELTFYFRFTRDKFYVTRFLIDQEKYVFRRMSSIHHCFMLTRVLSRVDTNGDYLLSILCRLTNLRYLHLRCDDKPIMFPESISKLQNLDTLIVTSSGWVNISLVFPLEIWKLQLLRHIVMTKKCDLQVPVPEKGCPVPFNLETLSWVRNINFTKSFVERISNLKKLKLKYTVEFMNDGQELSMENLQYLHQLEELSIHRDKYNNHFIRPTNFVFPQNLQRLSLEETRIPLKNLSHIGLLPNLKVLKLKSYSVKGDEWEPNEGEFLQLEHLKMEDLPMRHWRAEGIHFPRLRKLVILECIWLKEFPESIGEIDTLETLIVNVYQEEAKRSAQKIQENQRDMGNDLLQVIIL